MSSSSRSAWAVLRIATHNARGLCSPGHAREAAAAWRALGFDIVCLQETRWAAASATAAAATAAVTAAGWTLYTAAALHGSDGRPFAGVAIAIRSALLRTNGGPLAVVSSASTDDRVAGRLVHVALDWRGHHLHVASVYLPSGDYPAQRAAVTGVLGPLAAAQHAAGRTCAWGSDFNFCDAPTIDRLRPEAVTPLNEAPVARAWASSLGSHLVDAFRALHPGRRLFSHFQGGGAARLDRVYVSGSLLPAVCRARAAEAPCGDGPAGPAALLGFARSDHRPVFIDVVHRQPVVFDAPMRRVRLDFRRSDPHWQAYCQHMESMAAAAPSAPLALLQWWPSFKRSAAVAAHAANRAFRAAARDASVTVAVDNLRSLYDAAERGVAGAAANVAAAGARLMEAAAADSSARQLCERREWVHGREYPRPGLTRCLQPPRSVTYVAALRTPAGGLAASPPALAEVAARHWAGVSAAPVVDAAARAAVLHALDATGAPALSAAAAAGSGINAAGVDDAEVLAAMRHMQSGKSPGLDGIPVELYRHCGEIMAPLLSRLFSAAWQCNVLPRGFLEGLIAILPKAGESIDPADYRPITLLGTDYRIFAKVLANRVRHAMPGVIDREQTAFLPDRRIGENVMCLQLLPIELQAEGRGALIAFCDFCKAYDTLDRDFLFAVMAKLGFDGPFLGIVRLLLSHTFSRARVNGCLSESYELSAGVRQGCPLAPFLYLFMGQALQRWLRHCGFGVALPLGSGRLTALQYADDTEVLLSGVHDVPAFVRAMEVFAAASGQRLNLRKTKLLPIGALLAAGLPATVAGLPIVSSAPALGFTFHAGVRPPATEWEARLDLVRGCYARAAAIGLSAMGRGLASASYGVSHLLYHAEFLDVPATVMEQLQRATRELILDGGVRRNADGSVHGARLFRVPGPLLAGSPKVGGWGALPLAEHLVARRAWWAGQLVAPGVAATPWLRLARARLQHFDGSDEALRVLPAPLKRVLLALQRLPPPHCVVPNGQPAHQQAALAQAAAAAPLPWLLGEVWSARDGVGQPLRCSGVRTVGALSMQLNALRAGGAAAVPTLLPLVATCERAAAALPPGWLAMAAQQAATGDGSRPPAAWGPAFSLTAAWVVQQPGGPGLTVRPWQLSVRVATQLQLGHTATLRQQRFLEFAVAAGSSAGAQEVATLFRAIWQLPCDNLAKEVMWALVYDAIPLPARLAGRAASQQCACGSPCPGRQHCFWSCPIAQHVVAEVARCLPAGTQLGQEHLWLARPPQGQLAGPWRVVALAALTAMEHVRRSVVVRRSTLPSLSVAGLSRRAAASFWQSIAAFCALDLAPPSWRGQTAFWSMQGGRLRPRVLC